MGLHLENVLSVDLTQIATEGISAEEYIMWELEQLLQWKLPVIER